MAAKIDTTISIQKTMLQQVDVFAQQLGITSERLFEIAVESYIKNHQIHSQSGQVQRTIKQGHVYWVRLEDRPGATSGIPHPYVVIQDDILNHSRIETVVACPLTSNLKRTNAPGNILLEAGELDLPRQSVVETSKVSTLYKNQLGEFVGSLTGQRVHQILAGIRFVHLSYLNR